MAYVGASLRTPWGKRLPVAAGGVVAKTYAEYQTQIAALATGGAVLWDSTGNNGNIRTTAAAATGAMDGSPWLAFCTSISALARIVQHAAPSQAAFDALVAGGFEVYLELTSPGSGAVVALNRNGYLSLANASSTPRRSCANFIYWDGAQAQQMNPLAGTGPTPYTW